MKLLRLSNRRAAFVAFMLLCCATFAFPAVLGDENRIDLSADITRWYPDDKITASGNVQATYLNYTITATSAEADLRTNIAVFQGKVKLTTKQNTIDGENLTLNLKTKDWKLDNVSSVVQTVNLQGIPSGKAFINSAELTGDDRSVVVHSGTLTTCDLERPHYCFSAKTLEIYPDSKIIARKVSMITLDKRIFTLNSLVIPIRGFSHNLMPQIGSSVEEGTFLKTAYAYAATERNQGFLKLDLMQRRGIGTGMDHYYQMTDGSGQVSLYYLADRVLGGNNITGRLQHQQKIGSINLDLSSNYRTNSYLYYPTTTSQNWQMNLNRNTSNTNTGLAFYSDNNRGFGNSEAFTSSLTHAQRFSETLSGLLAVDMRKYDATGMSAADREMESTFELYQREDKYDLSLIASRRTDLDDDEYTGDDFYYNIDRLPELRFETDSYRLGRNLLFGLPSRLMVGAGRYHEEPSGISKNRLLMQWDMLGQNIDLSSKNELSLTAGYRQAYYADNMAQYVLRLGGTLTNRYNDYMRTRFSYSYQQPEGFSPFRFDYTGEYNYLRTVMDYQDNQKLRWSLSTGYDMKNDDNPWQDLALRLAAHPNSNYAFSISTGYDLNRSKWRSLINRFQVAVPNRIGLDLGTKYDVEKGKLSLARGRLDLHIGRKWRLESITSWNGLAKKFDYQGYRLTRDLHCWEASISYNDETGFRKDKGFSLELRIKALPSIDRFGIGQYGQAVDTSLGEYYY